MSADNILIIAEVNDKIRVYDVNFSDISSQDAWVYGNMTPADTDALVKFILDNPYYKRELHKCNTVSQAEGFCNRYQRENIVEYGYTSIVRETKKV